jgi:hypothetical protein
VPLPSWRRLGADLATGAREGAWKRPSSRGPRPYASARAPWRQVRSTGRAEAARTAGCGRSGTGTRACHDAGQGSVVRLALSHIAAAAPRIRLPGDRRAARPYAQRGPSGPFPRPLAKADRRCSPEVTAAVLWECLAGTAAGFSPALSVAVSPRSGLCPPGCAGIVVIGGAVLATAADQETALLVGQALSGLPAAASQSEERVPPTDRLVFDALTRSASSPSQPGARITSPGRRP